MKGEAGGAGTGPFDPEEGPEDGAEEDLWFLPAVEDFSTPRPPRPRAEGRLLFDPGEWRAAQGMLAAELAQTTLRFGMLGERLAGMGEGARHRLALREVADLGWWSGERIGTDRLSLWIAARAGMAGDDAQALARAGWAVRRLTGGAAPFHARGAGGWSAGITAFLGRGGDAAAEVAEVLDRMEGLHPVVAAAVLFHAWRLAAPGPAAGLEAAVLAARHAATMGSGASFLPLAMSGVSGLNASGSAERRLALWLTAAEQATLSALAQLDRLRAWEVRARAVTADLSGRTPPRLIGALVAWPALSAPMAEQLTSTSRAAAQRNLDTFTARGLVREITGQGRFRLWTAAIHHREAMHSGRP